jgi:hypothetical protein
MDGQGKQACQSYGAKSHGLAVQSSLARMRARLSLLSNHFWGVAFSLQRLIGSMLRLSSIFKTAEEPSHVLESLFRLDTRGGLFWR